MKVRKAIINNTSIAWGIMVIIVGLMFARDIYGLSVNKFIFIGLAGVAMFLVSKYEMCELIAFLIPLFAGLPGNYISCIALILLLVKSKGNLILDKVGFICITAILIIELAAEIMSGIQGYSFSIVDYVKFAGAFLLTFILIFDANNQYNYWKLARNFMFGLLFAIVIIVGEMLKYYSFANFITLGVRIGDVYEITGELMDEMSLTYNSNALGKFCSASIVLCLLALAKVHKKWVIPMGIVFLLIGIMTQSRAFIITLFFGIIMYIVIGNNKPSTTIKKLFILIICAVLGGLIVSKYIPSYYESLIGRFNEADISNGRIDITTQYWDRFIGNENVFRLLFGVGLQNYANKYGMTMSAHFGFEEVLITWGLVGITCILIMLLRMVKILKYQKLRDYDMLIPFGVYILGLQSGQFFSDTASFMSLLIWVSFAKIKGESKEKTVELNNDR